MQDRLTWKDIVKAYGTQKGFAEHFGIPLRTVQDWCRGLRTPPEYVKRLICKDLNLPAEE